MKIPPLFYPPIALVVCLLAVMAVATPVTAAFEDWKPVDPSELSLKTPTVEKEADAEGLFWEVRIEDSPEGDLIFNHYLRVKVFTERGRESQSKIDLPFGNLYGGEVKIKDIAARTIKPDGFDRRTKKRGYFRTDHRESEWSESEGAFVRHAFGRAGLPLLSIAGAKCA